MVFPEPFKHQPSAIASFNYTDIAEGTGITTYLLAQTSDENGHYQILTTKSIYSAESQAVNKGMEITATTSAASATKIIDKDFDLTAFNLPQRLRGTAVLNMAYQQASSVGGNTQGYVIARIVNATTGVTLVSTQTDTVQTTATKNYWLTIPLVIPLSTTQFKKGETLRLTVECWGLTPSGTIRQTIGCDPQGRDGDYILAANGLSTKSTLDVPFDLDL